VAGFQEWPPRCRSKRILAALRGNTATDEPCIRVRSFTLLAGARQIGGKPAVCARSDQQGRSVGGGLTADDTLNAFYPDAQAPITGRRTLIQVPVNGVRCSKILAGMNLTGIRAQIA